MEKEMKNEEIKRKAKEWFASYTANYDMQDPKIALKAVHTYHVAELCEKIAQSLSLDDDACLTAWLCGLLHDVGRFEQIRRYHTFSDADSIDHALLSIEILFGDESDDEKKGRIREVLEDASRDDTIYQAVKYHSAYRLPQELHQTEKMFCDILRDADKIDIFRVNLETPMEDIYNTTTEELKNAFVTPEVLQAFHERHAVLRALKKTPVDHVVGHICLTFELVYPESRKIVRKQGYLDRMMHFESKNPKTLEQFGQIREEMQRYLK